MQQVYALRCLRYYGQIDGVFLTLDEIQEYLRKHPKQPNPPNNMFDISRARFMGGDYWEFFDEEKGIYKNYYFHIAKIWSLEPLKQSMTFLDDNNNHYVLFKNNSYGTGTPVYSSRDRHRLMKLGLEALFQKSKRYRRSCDGKLYDTDEAWFEKLGIKYPSSGVLSDDTTETQLEELWDLRIDQDQNSTKYFIMDPS